MEKGQSSHASDLNQENISENISNQTSLSLYDNLNRDAGGNLSMLKSYLAMGEFDVSMDDLNAQNIDPDNLHNQRAFNEPLQSLSRHFEMNQSSQYSASSIAKSSGNTHIVLDEF